MATFNSFSDVVDVGKSGISTFKKVSYRVPDVDRALLRVTVALEYLVSVRNVRTMNEF